MATLADWINEVMAETLPIEKMPAHIECSRCGSTVAELTDKCPCRFTAGKWIRPISGYDYTHQVWVEDGKYVSCAHPDFGCMCYGRLHAGEPVADNAEVR